MIETVALRIQDIPPKVKSSAAVCRNLVAKQEAEQGRETSNNEFVFG